MNEIVLTTERPLETEQNSDVGNILSQILYISTEFGYLIAADLDEYGYYTIQSNSLLEHLELPGVKETLENNRFEVLSKCEYFLNYDEDEILIRSDFEVMEEFIAEKFKEAFSHTIHNSSAFRVARDIRIFGYSKIGKSCLSESIKLSLTQRGFNFSYPDDMLENQNFIPNMPVYWQEEEEENSENFVDSPDHSTSSEIWISNRTLFNDIQIGPPKIYSESFENDEERKIARIKEWLGGALKHLADLELYDSIDKVNSALKDVERHENRDPSDERDDNLFKI